MSHARRAYLQKREEDGQFFSVSTYAAWEGFRLLGIHTSFFTERCKGIDKIDLTLDTIVNGDIGCVRYALSKLGVPDPHVPTMPDELLSYAGREIWTPTYGEFRQSGRKAFIKPLRDHKLFTGHVTTGSLQSLSHTSGVEDDVLLFASEIVEFEVEYRTFWLNRQCLGARFYAGDYRKIIDFSVADRAGKAYETMPAACSLDFGLTSDGRTLLVEVNDAFALGHYGMPPVPYAQMIEARWLEMVGLT